MAGGLAILWFLPMAYRTRLPSLQRLPSPNLVVVFHSMVHILRHAHCLRLIDVSHSSTRLASEVVEDNPGETALTTKHLGVHENILGDQPMVITASGTTADVRARLAERIKAAWV